VLPGIIGLATLIEYLGGWNLGVDQLLVRDFSFADDIFPGRMGPLTASCLLFFSAALLISGQKAYRKWQIPAASVLTLVVMMIAGVAAVGYFFGVQVTSGWGAYTRMAVQTAGAFFCLGGGLLIWTQKTSPGRDYDLLPWIPITGAFTLMTMIATISMVTVTQLKDSMAGRKHSGEVIAAEETFQNHFLDVQRSLRAYVTLDAPAAWQAFQQATNTLPKYFAALNGLTVENPAQKTRVAELATDLKAVLDYDNLIIKIYRQKGAEAVLKYDKTGANQIIVGRMLDDLKGFNYREQQLLAERNISEQQNYDTAWRLLAFGSVSAALLLFLAQFMTSRETWRRRTMEKVLRESEERFRSLVTGVKDYAIYMLDAEGRVASWNSGAQTIEGYSADEIMGQHFSRFFTPEDQRRRHPWDILVKAWREGSHEEEGWRVKKDGSMFMASVLITALRNDNGSLRGFSKIKRDVTERTRVEARLRESEERFRRSFDDAPIGIALVSPLGRWLKVNRALCDMLGYAEEELLALDFQTITHAEDLGKDLEYVQQVLAGNIQSYHMEKRYYHKLGRVVFVTLSVSLVRDRAGEPLYFISQIENITERKQVEGQIAASLKEKDALLREIHHRVKNNMQVISSILKLQTNYIRDPQALEVFNDCQNRIRTMALVHEKLYRTEGLAQIDFKEYLTSLAGMLFRSQASKGLQVRLGLQLEPVALDADTAIPLGLIVNELITNCLKHAFKERQKGFVLIILRRYDASECQIVVKDDGRGLDDHFLPAQTRTLGMRLIQILIEQIHGRLEYKSENGAEFTVTFRNQTT
jgi:PAS domain S-box-containing protein